MHLKQLLTCAAVAAAGISFSSPASAGPDEYLGEIIAVGFNFCPRGTASADGQILPINQNQSLYSLLGTTYGGDGRTTFALPDLRGRVPIGDGGGAGSVSKRLGERGGSETNVMTEAQMPRHRHVTGVRTSNQTPDSTDPAGNSFTIAGQPAYATADPLNRLTMHENTIGMLTAGGGQAQNNMQPYQAIKFCIVLQGTFPSRS